VALVCKRRPSEKSGGLFVFELRRDLDDDRTVSACYVVALLVGLRIQVEAQAPDDPLPRFEDYLVVRIFTGTPVAPVLTKPEERRYRTVIRNGVSKGWGVAEEIGGSSRPGQNFGGHYFLITWPNGTSVMMAIVDADSGRVFPPPFNGPANNYFDFPDAFPKNPPLDYRLNSRLLIVKSCDNRGTLQVGDQDQEPCGTYYFVMEKDGLKLIRKVPFQD
jgi:hypothetical protein